MELRAKRVEKMPLEEGGRRGTCGVEELALERKNIEEKEIR
jgi:hypothetical protein